MWTKQLLCWGMICGWLLGLPVIAWGQSRAASYHDGLMTEYSLKENGCRFLVHDLDLSSGRVRAAYFAKEGEARYQAWQDRYDRRVLCYFAVGFAKEWEQDQPPLGLAVEGGTPVNRALDTDMDGLVLIDGQGQVSALHLDQDAAEGTYYLRRSGQKEAFLRAMRRSRGSAFQTQLMYSRAAGELMGEDKHGKRAARRFLAICKDRRGQVHHLIMDLNKAKHLNLAAKAALQALRNHGYQVEYLLNQDTGSRNIMAAFDERGRRLYASPVLLAKATQLVVYYVY